MTGTMEILAIVAQLVAATAMVALTVLLSAFYWRKVIRQRDDLGQQKERALLSELDFTRKKERLASSRQTRRAMSKVDLMWNVLHDVQAVHQGIDSYLRLMLNSDLSVPKEEWDMMCSEMKKKSSLLTEIVDSSLEVLEYESLDDVPRTDSVIVNSFCEDMLEACGRYLKNSKIELSLETALPDDYPILTNSGYLRKLLKNLLICSMEYTTEGYIRLMVLEEKKRNRLQFILNDTGTGIPDEIKETVFDKLPKDSNLRNKIVGVRLRICRALTNVLGGSVYIDTNYSPGTSIVFSIKTK